MKVIIEDENGYAPIAVVAVAVFEDMKGNVDVRGVITEDLSSPQYITMIASLASDIRPKLSALYAESLRKEIDIMHKARSKYVADPFEVVAMFFPFIRKYLRHE